MSAEMGGENYPGDDIRGNMSKGRCLRTCTPSPEASHCNEIWPLLKYELAKTSWLSSKDMDTAAW